MLKFLVLIFAIYSSVVSAEPGGSRILLVPANDMLSKCNRGSIKCKIDGGPSPEFSVGESGLSMTYGEAERRGLKNRRDEYRPVYGILNLTTQVTEEGFKYFTATSTIFIGQLKSKELEETHDFDDLFWASLTFIPSATIDSDSASTYLKTMDGQIRAARFAAEQERREEISLAAREKTKTEYERSDAYKASVAAKKIIYCQRLISNARAAIAKERRIATAVGYVNKNLIYEAGRLIVECEDGTKANWRDYKTHGGKAGSIAALLVSESGDRP
jgi:hypothetical protein